MGSPAVFGSLKEFNPDADRITPYLERMAIFLKANKVADADRVPVFLSVIGGKAYSLLRDLLAPSRPEDATYEHLGETLKKHFEPNPIVIAQRFHFYRRTQSPEESVAEFLAELRRLATHCKFEAFLDDALRDRLVCGLRSEAIQKRLLSEADLTLKKAVELAQGMEAADKNVRSLKQTHPVQQVGVSGGSQGGKECYRCGRSNHGQNECRFKKAVCHKCGKIGHIAPVCRSRRPPQTPFKGSSKTPTKSSGSQPPGKRTGWIGPDETEDSQPDLPICCLSSDQAKPIQVEVHIEGKTLRMEVDTGAALSLISGHVKQKLFPETLLLPSQILLRTYTGESMGVLGEMRVQVKYGKQSKPLTLVVVEGNGPSLFGRNWLEQLRLNWKQIGAVAVEHNSPTGVDQLCAKYQSVFEEELGCCKQFTARLQIDDKAKPKFYKARSVPYSIREAVDKQLDEMEATGIIEKVSHSEWASPVVMVPKLDGKFRVCGDFKVTLNPVLDVDQYPLPRPEDLFTALAGGKKFTKLDLSKAYHQICLEEESQKLAVINTQKGLYKFRRLPFGVASAPAMFQKVMDSVLQGIPGVICYIDDILITGSNDGEHLTRLEEVLSRLQKHGFRLKQSKCRFMLKSVEYLGFIVDAEGIHPSPSNTKAVVAAPQPRNVKELRAFLGMVNYYRKFIPDLATILKPLTTLLQHDVKWCWNSACVTAFEQCKEFLVSSKVLVHYDPKLPLRMAADASCHGVGAVLSHVFPNGEEKPIAYASRTLTPTECNYAQIEKEALGIVFGIHKFNQYLYGRKFTLITDHKPLTSIFGPKKGVPALAAARLQRWAIQLSAYQYDVNFRATDKHANADCLSRLPLPGKVAQEGLEVKVFQVHQTESLPVLADHVKQSTQTDPVLRKVLRYTREGWPNKSPPELKPFYVRRDELSIENQCLLWGVRVIVPSSLREKMLVDLHQNHPGITKMKMLARSHFWWPNLDKDIEQLARSCQACHEAKQAPQKAPLHPWAWPSKPWHRIHLDFAGPFMGKMFLLAIDAHSKWGEIFEMSTTTSLKTIEVLRGLFAAYGLPQQVVTDNGPQFISEEFASFMRLNGIKHTRSAPYHPESNGEAERFVRTFKQSIKASKYDGLTLSHRLQSFLLSYRSTPHSTTNVAPCELFLGRKVRTRLDLVKPAVEDRVVQNQAQQKAKHDLHARYRDLHVGQQVMVRNMRPGPTWIPGRVIQKLGPVTYVVDVKGGDRAWKCHIDQLKDNVNIPISSAVPQSQVSGDTSDSTDFDFPVPGNEPVPVDDPVPAADEQPARTEDTGGTPHVQESEADPVSTPETPPGNVATPTGVSATPPLGHKYPLRDRTRHRRHH